MQHSAAAIFCCWFQHPLAGRLQQGLQNSCQGQRCKKSNAEAQVLYWVHVFSTDTCLTCWNIAFNKRSTHETACLQSPCLLISIHVFIQAFLIFVTAESYSCTHNLHLKVSSPLRVLRNGNLSPLPEVGFLNGVQWDDFSRMGVFSR